MRTVFLSLLTVALAAAQCPTPNATFSDSRQCDVYYRCEDNVPYEQLCPDGLVFNEKRANNLFPCDYPSEVDCTGRENLQPARSTAYCARAWGYFGTGDRADCGRFFNCVDGREFLIQCPEGLAFSSFTYRCEWPEASLDCDYEAYLGFSCPAQDDPQQVQLYGHARYASPRDCRKYFICVNNAPRLQTCDLGLVYNPEANDCAEPETVRGCEDYYPPEELAAIRKQREENLARAAARAAQREEEYQRRLQELAEARASGRLN